MDTKGPGNRDSSSGSNRRSFFKKLAAAGAAMAYVSPSVKAFSPQQGGLSPGCGVFNLPLPATFDWQGQQSVGISAAGRPPVPIAFNMQAQVVLTEASPCLANITTTGMGQSVDPDPLSAIGLPGSGRLRGTIGQQQPQPGNFGQLELDTGRYVQPPQPVFFEVGAGTAGLIRTQGLNVSTGNVTPANPQTSNYNCDVDIDADVAIPTGLPNPGNTLDLGLQNMQFIPRP